jgi:alpha-galactosidase
MWRYKSYLSSIISLAFCVPLTLPAQQPIHFNAATKVFRIDSGQSTYAFGVAPQGQLETVYWGGRLLASDPLPAIHDHYDTPPFESPDASAPQEYGGWGNGMYIEPALKVTFPDGNRDLVLHYVSHTLTEDSLTVLLKDISRDIYVTLLYTVDVATGVIGRSGTIQNKTTEPVIIAQAAAAALTLPVGDHYQLSHLDGRWADEFSLQQEEIQPGKIVLDSRRGSTGHQNNPWFAIERSTSTDEDHGDVWFGALAWSGSWAISIEQDPVHRIHIVAGFNPFDFSYKLAPGETLQSPTLYAGFTGEGLGGASRLLHRFELMRILPQAPKPHPRPVLYNSWEATEFAVDELGQEALAEKAASIGVERFVMDDGWFGQRNSDHAGLGDWYVNPKKFPHGLKPLIDKVHSLGMDFGLWVEPEMVNPDSDLYRAHPDWVLNFTGRPRTESRNQLVLNLARPDVREYVFHFLDKLLSENDIAFLKWDYNRNWSEPGWPAVAPDEQQKVYVDYVQNLYSILRDIRAKYPKLEIESCSGGGGRADLGIMHFVDQFWVSDNTDAFDRLLIQDGFTQAYSPGIMMAWVTDSPSGINQRVTSLDYRFLSSMQGSLGVGANLTKWTPQELATAKQWISDYKKMRETIQHGSLYRLISPQHDSEDSATESVSLDKKQAVLFTFLHSSQETLPYPTVRLRGLEPDTQYRLQPLHGAQADAPQAASGRYWMQHGITPSLSGDFKAAAFTFSALPE